MKARKYDLILLDLDGTITDSQEGIFKSLEYSFIKMGLEVPEREDLKKFIGPHFIEAFPKYLGLNEEETNRMMEFYRERYIKKGIYENKLYPEMENVLLALKKEKLLGVATAKPEPTARIIIDNFKLTEHFAVIKGTTFDGTMIKKAEVIKYIIDSFSHIPKDKIVMIGDRINDVEGARANGIDVIGALYGYGNKKEFEHAVATIEKPIELLELLL